MNQHYIEMLKAAVPYAPENVKVPISIVLQMDSISAQVKDMQQGNYEKIVNAQADLQAQDLDLENTEYPTGNIEAMLMQMQNFALPKEREMIRMLLNYVRAGKLLRNYQQFNQQRNATGTPPSMMDFFMSQLTEEQRSSLELMKMMMDNNETT